MNKPRTLAEEFGEVKFGQELSLSPRMALPPNKWPNKKFNLLLQNLETKWDPKNWPQKFS